MRICFFTKYPPTEGGTASRSYWLARGLGEQGIEVHIITDALKEKLYRENINFEDPNDLTNYQPPNVYVHSLDSINFKLNSQKDAFFRQDYESRLVELGLVNLGIEAIERYQCELIDSYYFLPHGISAYFAKKITHRPLILRHAGSDITRVISEKPLHPFFQKFFSEADLIFTHQERSIFFQEMGIPIQRLFFGFNYGVDSKYFNPQVSPIDLNRYGLKINPNLPIITYIGKAAIWKGIYELVEAASKIKEDFLLLFVTDGLDLSHFKGYLEKFPSLRGKYYFLGFVPPWKIPAILKRSRCLVQLERDFPVPFHIPIQPLEAMAVGTCSIIGKEIYEASTSKGLRGIEKGKNILVVNPKNIEELKNLLEKVIKDKNFTQGIGQEARETFNQEVFPNSVSATIKIYETVLQGAKSFKACLEELRKIIIKYLAS